MKALTISCASFFLAISSVVHAVDIYQYEQSPGNFGGFSSDGSVYTVADSFQLGQETSIGTLTWWGGYLNTSQGVDNFTVSLYSNAGGQPGTLLQQYNFGQVASVATGQFVNAPDLYPEYQYSANLATPFIAQAGVTYWLSIVNPPANYWLWEMSASTLNPGVQRSFDGGAWQPFNDNTAFALTAVPEPSSLSLLTFGLFSFWMARQRGLLNAKCGIAEK